MLQDFRTQSLPDWNTVMEHHGRQPLLESNIVVLLMEAKPRYVYRDTVMMDGWMDDLRFYVFSTVLQSYHDGRLIMKG